jgi:hypothetical protein
MRLRGIRDNAVTAFAARPAGAFYRVTGINHGVR